MVVEPGYNSLPFFDSVKPIDRRQGDVLHGTTRPMDFDGLHRRAFPQTKVDALIVRGSGTSTAKYVRSLAHAPSGETDGGSHGIPRTLRTPDQLKVHPVVLVRIDIAQEYRHIIQLIDHNVHFTVVEKIAESGAFVSPWGLDKARLSLCAPRKRHEPMWTVSRKSN